MARSSGGRFNLSRWSGTPLPNKWTLFRYAYKAGCRTNSRLHFIYVDPATQQPVDPGVSVNSVKKYTGKHVYEISVPNGKPIEAVGESLEEAAEAVRSELWSRRDEFGFLPEQLQEYESCMAGKVGQFDLP